MHINLKGENGTEKTAGLGNFSFNLEILFL